MTEQDKRKPEEAPSAPSAPAGLKTSLAPGGTLDTLGRASLLGLHLVSGMIVGALLGYGLDRWLGTFPWCAAGGFFFGVAAGFRNMWIDARYLIRQGQGPGKKTSGGDAKHVDQNHPRR